MFTFYFILLYSILLINGKYVCTKNSTVLLQINEIAFFETPNYPALITEEELLSCYIKFAPKKENQTNYRVIAGFLYNEFAPLYYGGSPTYFLVNLNEDYTYPFKLSSNMYYSQQGFVMFDDGTDNCPLQSISNPFVFEDPTQVIYIKANEFYNLTDSCQWKFVSPKNYGFKVVFMQFNFATKILITNSTDVIVNQRSLKLNHPYYNNDNFINFYWYNLPTNLDEDSFYVSVSIVKKEFNYTNINCTLVPIDSRHNTTRWTNFVYPYKGLQNNAQCAFNLTIPKNTAVVMERVIWSIESNVDIMQYYRSENDIVQIHDLESDGFVNYMFEPSYDGIERNVLFEFKSDGSISSLGFLLQFTFLKCKCKKAIHCNGQQQSIMGGSERNYMYCGNLKCNIKIKPCSSGFGHMLLYTGLNSNEAVFKQEIDIFKIVSNGETILQIDNSNRELYTFDAYLNSSHKNILEVMTGFSHVSGQFLVSYEPYIFPSSNVYIILTSESPYRILDFSGDKFYVVELSDTLKHTNISIFVYRSSKIESFVSIYNNESLSYNLNGGKNCFNDRSPYICEIKKSNFAVFVQGDPIVVKLSVTDDDCVFQDIIYTTEKIDFVNITAVANSKGVCDIIWLNSILNGYFHIYYLWTTAKDQNVKVFIGKDKSRLYFEFNSITAKKWQKIGLLSQSYIIEIPKNASLFIKLMNISNPSQPLEYPHHSIISTAAFGTKKIMDAGTYYDYIYYDNVTLKFTTLYYNMSPDSFVFQLSDESYNNYKNISIHTAGDVVTIRAYSIKLCYTIHLGSDEAMFLVEPINIILT